MKIENKEMMVNFGAFGYDAKKISSILGVPEIEIIEELANKDSELFKLIQKGKDMSDYVIDLKIFQLAKQGDVNAISLFEKRKEQRLQIAKSKQRFAE